MSFRRVRVLAFVLLAGAACGAPGASTPPPGSAAGTSLREGVLLVSTIGGGEQGRSDRLEISEDGVARLWFKGRLQAATQLGAEHRRRLDELVATSAPIRDGDASDSSRADGIRSTLALAGRGRGEDRREIERFVAEVGGRLMAHAEVWAASVLVVGRPAGAPLGARGPARQVRIRIDEVLTGALDLAPGAIVEAEQAFLPAGAWSESPRAFRLDASLAKVGDRSYTVRWARGVAVPPVDLPRILEEQRALAP